MLLKRTHGGAQVLDDDEPQALLGASFQHNALLHRQRKRAIARRAAQLCRPGDTIIINGGSTTFHMSEFLADARLTILTNSFLMAHELLLNSRNEVLVPGGMIYREQNVIASPFGSDVIEHHYASKMFMGACGVSLLGLLESDPLLVQAELRLMAQAEQLVLLVDSSKFERNGAGLIVCPLSRVSTVITDNGVHPSTVQMLRQRNIDVMVVDADEAGL